MAVQLTDTVSLDWAAPALPMISFWRAGRMNTRPALTGADAVRMVIFTFVRALVEVRQILDGPVTVEMLVAVSHVVPLAGCAVTAASDSSMESAPVAVVAMS